MPKNPTADVIGRQLLRSGTSVGANYGSACTARSTADFTAKMGIVEEEADESLFWMELLIENKLIKKENLEPSMKEADEILAIIDCIHKDCKIKENIIHVFIPHSEIRNPKSNHGGW